MEENIKENIKPLIQLKDVSKFYKSQNNVALGLHTVSTSLYKNEIVAITGQSGSGKSTFLNVICGVDSYESGNIYFNGEDTSYFNQDDMESFRKENVGFIFQNYNLIDSYSVLQNVMVPLLLKGMDFEEAKTKAEELLDKVGILDRKHHKSTKLSGGEKQRCVIARALAVDSPILACDEPTGNLDEKTGKEIIDLIKEVSKDKLVLIVTHDYEEVSSIVTRRLRFSDGDLVEDVELANTRSNSNAILKLDDVKDISTKSKFYFGLRNSFATPKKFIFSLLVFLAITFSVVSMYAEMVINLKESDDSSSYFKYNDKDRVLAFKSDMSEFSESEKEALDTTYFANPMFTNSKTFKSTFQDSNSSSGLNEYIYLNIPSSLKLEGKLPTKAGEVVLFRNPYRDFKLESLIGKTSVVYLNKSRKKITLTVSGVVNTSNEDYPDGLYAPYNYDEFLNASYENDTVLDLDYNGLVQNEEGTRFPKLNYLDDDLDMSGYDLTFVYDDKLINETDAKNIFKKIYFDYFDYKISLSEENFNVLYMGYSEYETKGLTYADEAFSDGGSYSLYTKASTVSAALKDRVFLVENFSKNKNQVSSTLKGMTVLNESNFSEVSITDIISQLFNSLFIINVIIVILIIYFISYFILSMIFRTKNKDYTMLRSLGMSKKSMASAVRVETIFLGLCSTLVLYLSILIINGILKLDNEFFSIFKIFSAQNYLVFLGIMILFSLLLANRFNKRLFKTTVNDSLKKEELNND